MASRLEIFDKESILPIRQIKKDQTKHPDENYHGENPNERPRKCTQRICRLCGQRFAKAAGIEHSAERELCIRVLTLYIFFHIRTQMKQCRMQNKEL